MEILNNGVSFDCNASFESNGLRRQVAAGNAVYTFFW